MADLSVVLVDAGPHAVAAQELAADWAREGLLRDSAWVSIADINNVPHGPPQVTAHVLSRDGVRSTDLFTFVGLRRLDLLRLVLVQLVPDDHGADAELGRRGRQLAALLQSVLPGTGEGSEHHSTKFRSINLIIGTSGTTGISPGALQPGWDVNALASPEDRPDLDRATIFVREPGNFTGHATASIATAGALWLGVHEGGLDALDTDSTSTEQDVRVVRHLVRAVIGRHRAQVLTDAAISAVTRDGAASFLDWARPAHEPGAVARDATRALLAGPPWADADARRTTSNNQAQLTANEGFRDALRFNLRLLRVTAGWLVDRGRRTVEDAASRAIVGDDADYVVRLRPATPTQVADLATDRLNSHSGAARELMLVAEGSTVSPPPPTTWGDLRNWCFALCDGSHIPDGFTAPTYAGTRELLPPGAVVPDPRDEFILIPDGTQVRTCDVESAEQLRSSLEQRADEERAAQLAVGPQAAEVLGSDQVPQGTDSENDDPPTAQDELQRLGAWIARRRGSILWELALDLARRKHEHGATADDAYAKATASTAPLIHPLERAQTTLVRCWKAAFIGFAAMSTIWALVAGAHDLGGLTIISGVAVELVLALVAIGVTNHQFYKALRSYEWQVQHVLSEQRATADRYVEARRESHRLALLLEALLDWAEIIGWVLHEPWRPADIWTTDIEDKAVDGMPASVAVAVPIQDSEVSRSMIEETAAIICGKGWSGRNFDEVVKLAGGHRGTSRSDGYLAADTDTIGGSGPRKRLLALLTTGTAQAELAELARERLREEVARGEDLKLPTRSVQRLGPYGGPPQPDDEFFRASLGESIPFIQGMWTANGLHRETHLPQSWRAWLPHAAADPGSTRSPSVSRVDGDIAVRVDVSAICKPSDILLFYRPLSSVPRLRRAPEESAYYN